MSKEIVRSLWITKVLMRYPSRAQAMKCNEAAVFSVHDSLACALYLVAAVPKSAP